MQSDRGENIIEWLSGDDRVALTLDQQKYVNKVKKLAEKHPDLVDIVAENDDGSLYATMPLSAIKISLIILSDDEKKKRAEALSRKRGKK